MKRISLLLAIAFLISCNTQKVAVQLNLEDGQTYHQVMTSKSTIVQSFQGQEMEMFMTITGGLTYTVKGKEDDAFLIDLMYDSLIMVMKTPGQEIVMSSESEDTTDMYGGMMQAFTGKAFTIKMNQTGEIIDVTGLENLYEGMADEYPMMTEEQKQQFREQMKDALGKNAMKNNLEMATAIFPDEPVMIGDTWQIVTQMAKPFKGTLTTTYELLETTNTAYKVHGDAVIESTGTETAGTQDISYTLNGTMSSDLLVDKKTGWINDADIQQKLSGNFEAQGITMPMDMTTTMTLKTVK